MNGITVLVALAAVGVDYGWQPGADGQFEYIVQIEPATLECAQERQGHYQRDSSRCPRRATFSHPCGHGHAAAHRRPGPEHCSNTAVHFRRGSAASNGSAFAALPGSGFGPGNYSGAATISDEPPYTAPSSSGILNLPPPPALIGPDGKASVLVRPGDRALPGMAPPANSGLPTYDSTPPDQRCRRVRSMYPLHHRQALAAGKRSRSHPESVPRPNDTPGVFGPQNPGGIFPVPAAGPETGLPEPIRGAGMNQSNQSSVEKTAANELDKQQTTTDLFNQLAAESQMRPLLRSRRSTRKPPNGSRRCRLNIRGRRWCSPRWRSSVPWPPTRTWAGSRPAFIVAIATCATSCMKHKHR